MKLGVTTLALTLLVFGMSGTPVQACSFVYENDLTEEERVQKNYAEADYVVVAKVAAIEEVDRNGTRMSEYTFTPVANYKGDLTKPFTRYSRMDSCGFFHSVGSTVVLFLSAEEDELSELTPYRNTYQGYGQAALLQNMDELLDGVATRTEVTDTQEEGSEAAPEVSPETTPEVEGPADFKSQLQTLRERLLELLRQLFAAMG